MRRSVWIFLLAIFVPSAVLGWLALRSAEEQKIILERRTAELYQHETDALAAAARSRIDEQRRGFAEAVRSLLTSTPAKIVAGEFTTRLAAAWPRKAVGFTIDANGQMLSPAPQAAAGHSDWQTVIREHGGFLSSSTPATVYNVPVQDLTQPEILRKQKLNLAESKGLSPALARVGAPGASTRADEGATAASRDVALTADAPRKGESSKSLDEPDRRAAKPAAVPPAPAPAAPPAAPAAKLGPEATGNAMASAPVPAPTPTAGAFKDAGEVKAASPPPLEQRTAKEAASIRLVEPQQLFDQQARAPLSNVAPEITEFRALTMSQNEGVLSRFVQDKLALIFWLRPPQAPTLIFGCVIEVADLADLWPPVMPEPTHNGRGKPEFVLALLDDRTRPVAVVPTGEASRDWKRPFVASEIGEALPHWEAALYLMRPEQLQESASGLRRTLVFLVVAMLGAIGLGGWLVVADARRQLALAQQKTDFVSNVSHELKTPLTSIRMFAELMLGGRSETMAKAPQYLRIIMVEAERLTRLINNVLDFAKLERRQKRFDKKPLDLHALVERLWEGQELHLRQSGFETAWEAAPPPYPVVGDEDALTQVLVNLLSNAEKYGGEQKKIELHTYFDDDWICVSVLDRGLGVPSGSEQKVFEAFYRAHDSLSSGIQGSGLGLTLAQRLANEHGGTIEYRPRDGGGSAFTLKLPVAATSRDFPTANS